MRIEGPVLLYGAGREARSTRAFLKARYPRLKVFVTVDSGPAEIEDTQTLSPQGLDPARFGLIVKSPGVSRYKRFFMEARDKGIALTSNLNLWAAHYRQGRLVIAVTGTKGKSTTAALAHAMLTRSGVEAVLAGNIGLAPLEAADKAPVVVFELSSYQTAEIGFAPDIAGLTNLYPEHIDWHGTAERYYADKLNLLAQGPARVALGRQAEGQELVRAALPPGAALLPSLDGEAAAALEGALPGSRLRGAHNRDNAALAARLALAAGATPEGIAAGIEAFAPLPHRLEELHSGGLLFVDDSIATTPEATKAALAAYRGKSIALIAGGHEREQDYGPLADLLGDAGVTRLCCLPVTGARLAAAARRVAPGLKTAEHENLAAAMAALAADRRGFDTVILSPGAPSYNQFKNFEERGEAFKALARALFE